MQRYFSASLANLRNSVWYFLHVFSGLAVEGRTVIFKYSSISVVDGEGGMGGLVEMLLISTNHPQFYCDTYIYYLKDETISYMQYITATTQVSFDL